MPADQTVDVCVKGENQRWDRPEADSWETKVEENRTQGRGKRNRRETRRERERGDAWRTGIDSEERTGESRGGKQKRRSGERSQWNRKRRKGSSESRSHLPGEKNRLRAGKKNRTLRSQQGGCSPMCRTPAAPTLYQSTASAHSIRLSIIAEPLAPLTSVSRGPKNRRLTASGRSSRSV